MKTALIKIIKACKSIRQHGTIQKRPAEESLLLITLENILYLVQCYLYKSDMIVNFIAVLICYCDHIA